MNKSDILVTVIFPVKCFDAINSILEQSFSLFELIVIDCDKSGLTASFCLNIQDERVVYQYASNNGYVKSLNRAVSEAKGKYIAMMDSYSIMYPEKLEKQFLFMEAHEEVDCSNTWVKATGDCRFNIQNNCSEKGFIRALLLSEPIINSSLMYRKSSLEKLGFLTKMYDSVSFPIHEYKLWIKLIIKGFVFDTVPGFLSEYNVSLGKTVADYTTNIKKASIQVRFLNYINSLIARKNKGLIADIENNIDLCQHGHISLKALIDKTAALYQSVYTNHRVDSSKNILICIKDLNSGGAERSLINLLERLDYDRYNVDLVVLTKYGVFFDSIYEKVNWYTLENFERYNVVEYDIEIAFLEGPSTKFIANRVNSAKKIAWVRIDLYTWHWTKTTYLNQEEEINTYKKFDLLLFNSKQTLECFLKRFGDIPVKKKVIYNVIDKQKIVHYSNEYNVPRDGVITLCSAGRLNAEKAYERLIRILNDLRNEGLSFRYWILGEGNLKTILENLILSFHLEDNVFLLGFHKNPYPYIKNCDVFVQTSLAEGFSLVVAEAICLGKPVLATDTAGPSELLDYGKYGCLVQNDYESILSGLRSLILNEKLRVEMADKSVQRSSMFDADGIVREIMGFFESLLEE